MVSDILPGRLEIRPKRAKNAVQLVFTSLIFVALGIYMISTLRFVWIVVGLVSISFFGFAALSAIIKAFRKDCTMALSWKGIEFYKDFGPVPLPWMNIQDIGSCGGYARMVGIRLKSYDEYLAGVPFIKANEAREKKKLWNVILLITYSLSALLPLIEDEQRSLSAYKDAESMIEFLRWNRESYEYDITLPWTELDRSPDEFLQLLENYIKRFGDAFAPDDESKES